MNNYFKIFTLTFLLSVLITLASHALHPATLEFVNSSGRTLTIKIMKRTGNGAIRCGSLKILSNSTNSINIDETGYYFLKVKAEINGRDAIYSEGDPFEAYVGVDGYSVLTITYSITESASKDPLEGKRISKEEFEND